MRIVLFKDGADFCKLPSSRHRVRVNDFVDKNKWWIGKSIKNMATTQNMYFQINLSSFLFVICELLKALGKYSTS